MSANVPSIPVRALVGKTTAFAERRLDEALGLTSLSSGAACPSCRGALEFDTDFIGRTIERCTVCRISRLPAAPQPRPEGEGYSQYANAPKRRERSDAQQLQAASAERAAAPMSPELLAAKREYDAYLASLKDGRKGGRPKLALGKNIRRDREPEPEMPGRPERLELPASSQRPSMSIDTPPPSTPEPSMARKSPTYAPRRCELPSCGTTYNPTGAKQRYCTPAHKQAHQGGEVSAPTKKAPEKKPRRVNTGYTPTSPRSTGGANDGEFSKEIERLEEKLAALDGRRERLAAAIESLRTLQESA